MSEKIYLFKNKQKWEVEPLFDWRNPEFKNKDFNQAIKYLGYNQSPSLTIGFEFPLFELYEWSCSREKANPYYYYGLLSLGDNCEDIVFENIFDAMDFLNHYAPMFELLNNNFLKQIEWQRD